jgi:hypothetical protein
MSASDHKDTVRFTFDCPSDLHAFAKMKAAALKKTVKDYLLGLLAKDAMENPPKFLNDKAFKKELKSILENDVELMQKLSKK